MTPRPCIKRPLNKFHSPLERGPLSRPLSLLRERFILDTRFTKPAGVSDTTQTREEEDKTPLFPAPGEDRQRPRAGDGAGGRLRACGWGLVGWCWRVKNWHRIILILVGIPLGTPNPLSTTSHLL